MDVRNINDHPSIFDLLLYKFSVPWTDELSCRSEYMVVLFITDATFINSFIFTDSLTPLMRKHVKKKVSFRNRRFCRCTHNSGSKLYNCTNL